MAAPWCGNEADAFRGASQTGSAPHRPASFDGSVGGHGHLPGDGQLRSPSHGHQVTQCGQLKGRPGVATPVRVGTYGGPRSGVMGHLGATLETSRRASSSAASSIGCSSPKRNSPSLDRRSEGDRCACDWRVSSGCGSGGSRHRCRTGAPPAAPTGCGRRWGMRACLHRRALDK